MNEISDSLQNGWYKPWKCEEDGPYKKLWERYFPGYKKYYNPSPEESVKNKIECEIMKNFKVEPKEHNDVGLILSKLSKI